MLHLFSVSGRNIRAFFFFLCYSNACEDAILGESDRGFINKAITKSLRPCVNRLKGTLCCCLPGGRIHGFLYSYLGKKLLCIGLMCLMPREILSKCALVACNRTMNHLVSCA